MMTLLDWTAVRRRHPLAALIVIVAAMAGPDAQELRPDARRASPESPFSRAAAGTRVTVLPFLNISGDPHDDWLSNGIAETVVVDLRNRYGLAVIKRDARAETERPDAAAGAPATGRTAVALGRDLGVT